MGSSGAYSDLSEWPVILYRTEAEAQAHAERARSWDMAHRESHRAICTAWHKRPAEERGEYPMGEDNPHDDQAPTSGFGDENYWDVVEVPCAEGIL